MTDPNYTHITLVIDRSGSMASIKEDTEGGVNSFIAEQSKLPGKVTVTLSVFDTHFDVIHDHVPIADVKPFVLLPRGSTALLDAMGKTITETGEWLASLSEEERPGKVTFVVVTDGQENSSQEFTYDSVLKTVTTQTNTYGWEFSFLAANLDAVSEGQKLGINPAHSLTYNTANVGQTFKTASASVTRSRMGGDRGYTEDERASVAP